MIRQIKSSFLRSQPTLLPDMAGVAALMVMLVIALHLPGFF